MCNSVKIVQSVVSVSLLSTTFQSSCAPAVVMYELRLERLKLINFAVKEITRKFSEERGKIRFN